MGELLQFFAVLHEKENKAGVKLIHELSNFSKRNPGYSIKGI